MNLTSHAKRRMQERRINLTDVKYALCCGARYESCDHTVCQIRHRQARQLGAHLRRLLGLTVIISRDSSTVITAYWEHVSGARN